MYSEDNLSLTLEVRLHSCSKSSCQSEGRIINVMVDEGNIIYIEVQQGNEVVTMGSTGDGCENFIEPLIRGDMRCLWDSEDTTGRDEFLEAFPDYHIFQPFLDKSPYPFIKILLSKPTYEDFKSQLKDLNPLPNTDICYDVNNSTFVTRDGKIMSIIFDKYDHEEDREYLHAVGEIEYTGSRKRGRPRDVYAPFLTDKDEISKIIPGYEELVNLTTGGYSMDDIPDVRDVRNTKEMQSIDIHNEILIRMNIINNTPFNTEEGALVCVKNQESERSSENDGMHICVALIPERKWDSIVSISKSMTDDLSNIQHDYSSGGYGCIIGYDIPKMIEECQVINDLTPDVISFIRSIEDDTFILFVVDQIRETYLRSHRSNTFLGF